MSSPEPASASAAGNRRRRVWTADDVHALGLTTDLETAAEIIGIGRTLAYELAKNDAFPVRLIRLGRRVLVPTADLTRLLGYIDPARGADGAGVG